MSRRNAWPAPTRWASLLLALALAGCAPATRVVLLPQADATSAAVEVQSRDAQAVLSQPFAVAELDQRGALAQSLTDAQAVLQRYGQLLSVQPAPTQRFTLYFLRGGAQLTPQSTAGLSQALAGAIERAGGEIVVVGHTDRVGTVESNDTLSLQRAQMVRQLLVARGFDPARVLAVGRGERQPIVPTADEVAEPGNRRVEILVR